MHFGTRRDSMAPSRRPILFWTLTATSGLLLLPDRCRLHWARWPGAPGHISHASNRRREALAGLLAAPLAETYMPLSVSAKELGSRQEQAGLRSQNNKDIQKYAELGEGLKAAEIKVPQVAEGAEAPREVQKGDRITVALVGRLPGWNGQVFIKTTDTSGFSESPVSFTVGAGEAIPGLDRGVLGMRKGGIRRLVIPPKLGYPRPMNIEDLGKKGAIPDPGVSSRDAGEPWELRTRLVNGVLNNGQRDDTLVIDVKIERIS
eukprot:TRINITY_DN74659_c0_g1_i1.p1 TRINITY_DN74659_c0_g1~~TRINITY_DN74659_c0_g1_i1.p1  ORF type:complete len:261 (-),score=30.72 TRINITY_DN74659_c0_g1_i1:21-803(-)